MKKYHYKYNQLNKSKSQYLRANLTFGEAKLWNRLKSRQVNGLKFRRQFPLLNYILDFYCNELKLAIEVDGSSHDENKHSYDKFRQKKLEQIGIRFLRFTENDVLNNIDNVMESIFRETDSSGPPLPLLKGGENNPDLNYNEDVL